MAKIFLRTWRPYAWIAALGFILYAQTLFFGYVYLDDNAIILDNFRSISVLSNIFQAFRQNILAGFGAFYRPITVIPYILDAQFGTGPFVYHFTNIAIHLLASCLLFLFLTKLGYKKILSFIFTLLFTVHPVSASVAAWIPGRVDSILAVFVLTAFIAFLEYLRTNNRLYYLLHLIFFALALFTKETALVLILMCLLYYFLIFKERAAFTGGFGVLALGWFLVSLGWYLARMMVLAGSPPLNITDTLKSLFNLPAVVLYVGKMLLPFNLSVLPILRDSSLIFGLVTLSAVLVLLAFTKKRRYGFILFGASWLVLFLLPSLVFSDPSSFTGVALYEHRIYLPLIGFIILLMETDLVRNNIDIKKKGLVVGVLIIISFSAMTFIHSGDFKNRMNFWESAVRTSSHHPLAHRNLGAMYYLDGFPEKAEVEYKKALELNPSEPMAHNNLGVIYMNQNRFKEAEQEFQKELKINSYYDDAYFNYGLLCAKQGRLKEAAALWKRTLEINPGHIDAYRYLKALNLK